jgi:hypothetical protein
MHEVRERPGSGAGQTAIIVGLLADLVVELKAIRAALEPRRPRRRAITAAEQTFVQALIPVVAAAKGDEPWTCRELLDDPHAGLRLVLQSVDAKWLGKVLSRAADAGVVDAGLCVRRVGTEITIAVWQICATA